ncbi:YidC/Oxa1 family membrane protein insertase [Sulfobacillus thermosulfidooxidans]|uniref:YidC/Oxa1 family membrane protein insertase n=1 Tax=Sulfobacillus thermosulfidooxidans TaxID=28034 RepID=UPI0006B4F3D9|nr:YidC/Oxa1 family membrane protein insertase [Sulfobacillus thermosulfidooxidans]
MGIWGGFLSLIRGAFVVFTGWTHNYVLGIILLTLMVRLILLPLGIYQARSMQKMAKVGPKQREIQQRHKGNPQAMQAELAKLYKEEGVNPASGCLPLLLQIPVMYGLFDVLERFKYVHHNYGFWVWQNLAKPDPTYILPILVAVSTFFMQKQTMMMTPQQPEMQQSQKLMLWMMPIVFGYVASRFPAGLSVYYVVSNLFQLGQTMWLLRRPVDGATGGGAQATR